MSVITVEKIGTIRVTDHAMTRYLDAVASQKGVDRSDKDTSDPEVVQDVLNRIQMRLEKSYECSRKNYVQQLIKHGGHTRYFVHKRTGTIFVLGEGEEGESVLITAYHKPAGDVSYTFRRAQ